MYGPNIQSLYSGRMLSCLYCTDISYLHLFTQFYSVYSLDFCGDVWMHFCIFIYSFSDNRYAWISFEHLNECMNVWRWSVEEVFQTLVKCFVQEYLYLYYFIYGSLRFIKILQIIQTIFRFLNGTHFDCLSFMTRFVLKFLKRHNKLLDCFSVTSF